MNSIISDEQVDSLRQQLEAMSASNRKHSVWVCIARWDESAERIESLSRRWVVHSLDESEASVMVVGLENLARDKFNVAPEYEYKHIHLSEADRNRHGTSYTKDVAPSDWVGEAANIPAGLHASGSSSGGRDETDGSSDEDSG